MAKKYAFQVKVPDDGPLTREQGWAALDRLHTQMSMILDRMNAERVFVGGKKLFGPKEGCVLPEDELNEVVNVRGRLKRLVKTLGKDVLDKLADIGEDEEDDDLYGVKKFPKPIQFLIEDGLSDVYRYDREQEGDMLVLAFALLEQCEWDNIEIGELIEKRCCPNSKYSDWYSCPLCDECEPGYIDHEECPMCYGWGYVHGDKPDYDQFPQSLEGRKAVARNEDWTKEQEEAAWRAETGEDEDD